MPNPYRNILDYYAGNNGTGNDASVAPSMSNPPTLLDYVVNGTSPLDTPPPTPVLPPYANYTPFPADVTNGLMLLPVPGNPPVTVTSASPATMPQGPDPRSGAALSPDALSDGVWAYPSGDISAPPIQNLPMAQPTSLQPRAIAYLTNNVSPGLSPGASSKLPTAEQAVSNAAPNAQGIYDLKTGTLLPGNVSVQQNMQLAKQHPGDLWWFANMVGRGAPWDYHSNQGGPYENAGNFNYGATGTAAGFSQGLLDRAAGAFHMLKHGYTPGQGTPFGGAPYGNSPQDLWEINRGIRYGKSPSS